MNSDSVVGRSFSARGVAELRFVVLLRLATFAGCKSSASAERFVADDDDDAGRCNTGPVPLWPTFNLKIDPTCFVQELSICSLIIPAETSFEHTGLVEVLFQRLSILI